MRARILFPLLFALAFPVSAGALTAPASLEDIILLAEGGVSNQTIRVFLSSRPVNVDLDADAIARLKEAGLSEENIQFLLDSFGERASETDKEVVVVVAPDPYPYPYPYPYYYYGSYYVAGATLHLGRYSPHWGLHFSFPFPFPIPVPHLSHTSHRVPRHYTTSHLHHRTSHNDGHRRHRETDHSVRHVSRHLGLAGDRSTGRQSRGHRSERSHSKAHESRSGRQHTVHASRGHANSKHASRGHANGKHASRGHVNSKHASRGHANSKHASRGHAGGKHASNAHVGKSHHRGGKHRGRH